MGKGQINIEFLAAAGLFILTLLGLLTSGQVLPEYGSSMDRMDLNLEAKSVTTEMLTEEGYHDYGSGGTNWNRNQSTMDNTVGFGLASDYHVVDRQKMEALKTATVDGSTGLNYTQFRNAADVTNQFHFTFVWLPTVQTNYSYIKGNPPSNPNIIEPGRSSYSRADNRVHYGTISIRSSKYNFLVTAHNGVYDNVYVNLDTSSGWDFQNPNPEEPYKLDDRVEENGFLIENIQNRENDRGAMVIMKKQLKEFGPSVDPDTEVVTMDRFAVMEGEPLRLEAKVW